MQEIKTAQSEKSVANLYAVSAKYLSEMSLQYESSWGSDTKTSLQRENRETL